MPAAKKLLVADDSLTIQKVIRLALSNEGYEIQTLADGKDAIEQISVFRPAAVLVDVALPTKSAFELKREINALPDLAKIKFILMSSAFEKVDEAQVKEVGFAGRLTKPFDPAHLRQIIQSVLENSAPPSSAAVSSGDEFPPPLPQFPLPQFPSATASSNTFDLPPTDFPPFPMEATNPGSLPTLPLHEKPEDDIKKLTESTIKMSGLDEFQWSIQETKAEPTKPQDLPPLPISSPSPAFDFEKFNSFEKEDPTAKLQPSSAASSAANSPAIPADQIQALVKAEVHRAIESTIQKILPEIAERILKEEIHRMLSE